ncbi:centrosomal protein of 162 kDa isoform X2 [Ambystoma mexicanum]|uniref:centrosomal protein of 162 kDa isoform X2 n=1 Tax=Ambystoma mexicanum TaxID=8296 RepID=UPI0037E940E2
MAQRMSKEELDEQFEQFLKESLSDDSFGSSKKPSVLETLGRPRKKDSDKKKEPSRSPWWKTDDDSEDGDMLGTSQSFLKSKKTSQPILEVDEDEYTEKSQLPHGDHGSVSISRDSLETDDSVVASGPSPGAFGIGLDTLEEQEEKEQFFARLERGASSTIDYSLLNKELDSADSIQLAALIGKEPNEKMAAGDSKDKNNELIPNEMDGDYSDDDFEDELDTNTSVPTKKENHEDGPAAVMLESLSVEEKREEDPGMLAKVMLLDSLESTMGTQNLLDQQVKKSLESITQQGTNEMTGTGISYGQTNSDIEALRHAYHHIDQSMGDTNEHKTSFHVSEKNVHDALNTESRVPKQISTTESDLPTVEELMKPIRDGPAFPRGFDLEPASPVTLVEGQPQMPKVHLSLKQQNVLAEQKIKDGFLFEWHNTEKSMNPQNAENEVNYGSNTKCIVKDHHVSHIHPGISKPQEHQSAAFLPLDKENHQVSNSPPKLWDTYTVSNKQVTFKTKPSSFLPKKSHGGHYASVRSSGYGKNTSPLKQVSSVGEKTTANNSVRRSNLKAKIALDPARKKGPLAANKTAKSAKNVPTFKEDIGSVTSLYFENPQQHGFQMTDPHLQSGNTKLVMDSSERIHAGDSLVNLSRHTQQELDLQKIIEELEGKWRGEHLLLEHLKEDYLQKENDLRHKMQEMKQDQERELSLLKQENYVLQSKLHSVKEMSQKSKTLMGDLNEPITDERLKEIQKEIKEQEELLQGYQQENEKLYHQVKELQRQNKLNEERMFNENQNLLAELASTREQKANLHLKQNTEHGSEKIKTHSFTELMSELRTAQKVQTDLMEEIKRLKQDKQSLEVDIGQVRRERDLAKAQIIHTSGDKSYEMKIMEESYKQEIFRLNKRLQWFAENQELLDKDAIRLRDASQEIEKLQKEVQKLKTEAGNRSEVQQKRLKDRAADSKRIQDLERQVKEMEAIIKRRHPNSLPALIYAAAAASGADDHSSARPLTTVFLERRIQKLESELEGKDEDAKKSLRSMEQQFQKVKIQYEQRIAELEQLLAYKSPKRQDQNSSHKTFDQELSNVKEAHQKTEANLLKEIEKLKKRNAELETQTQNIDDKDFYSIEQQIEQANVNARLVRLNQELSAKSKEVQGLSKTVERLQKERMAMLSDHTSSIKLASKQKPSSKAKRNVEPAPLSESETTDLFPTTFDEKAYQPDTFTDTHISEVLQENEKLKKKLERLSGDISQQKTQYQAAVAVAESNLRRAKEDTAAQLTTLKLSHQRELERIICQHAVEHSSSRIAELSSKASSQEILIKHLQDQVKELQRDRECLAKIQIREQILQKEMTQLLEELGEAKESHSPEMKHFRALENKIKQMENRHAQRELELQQIIQQTRDVAEAEQTQEVEKWRKLAHTKNQELERFRVELDAILDVLRELQRQGVVIPAPTSASQNLSAMLWNA